MKKTIKFQNTLGVMLSVYKLKNKKITDYVL